MDSFELNDTRWDSAAVKDHREYIIKMRDAALKANDFHASVLLSITIGLLHHLAEELKKDE